MSNTIQQPVVIGAGETGTAIIQAFLRQGIQCAVHDPEKRATADLKAYAIAHVCVPAEHVEEVVRLCRFDALIIVHASTLPGTVDALRKTHTRIVHAPIEGRHPMISEYLVKWCMPVTGLPEAATAACAHMRRASIPAMPWNIDSINSEMAKHLSTLRLGFDVAWLRMVYRLCEAKGLSFDHIYTDYTRAYNTAYAAEAKVRPVLTPEKGKSKSHCVGPNAKTLGAAAEGSGDEAFEELAFICKFVAAEMERSI